ncbi:hypothetical protein J7643_08105 [bacterium]|nr:hypothetical protein [bacterium]
MQSYWISVSYDADVVLNHCFKADSREEAVSRMMTYLELEFGVSRDTEVTVTHH